MMKNSKIIISYILIVTFALTMLTACQKRYIIPEQNNADEQLAYAVMRHLRFEKIPKRRRLPGEPVDKELSPSDSQLRAGEIALAAYQKVIDAFPNEKLHVNRATLGLARVNDDLKRNEEALEIYEELIEQVPSDDTIQIQSLFYAARILDQQKKYDRANAYYRQVIDRFKSSKNPEFIKLVILAKREYQSVGEK